MKRPDVSESQLLAWILQRVATATGIDVQGVDQRATFRSLGLSSIHAAAFARELEDVLDRSLSDTLLYQYPTPLELALGLAREPSADDAVEADEELAPSPIAIVGIGCRFPGATGPQAFWELVRDGRDAIGEVPRERWDWAQLRSPARPELLRWGGFIDGVEHFDREFFGISQSEANAMDPQQRHLLEVAWEAFEDAGVVPSEVAGKNLGVFVGTSSNDYALLQVASGADLNIFTATGNSASIAANRLSFFFDLRGPSLTIDTACSSSLLAVHLAAESILRGECSMALAAGSSLMLSPILSINLAIAEMASPSGRCRPFSSSADGIVRGEGVGVVVLKRLADAERDGDRIYAVLRGSAVQQDGRSNGLVAPTVRGQRSAIRRALRRAGVAGFEIQYVECHGTGTALGDPIEAEALGSLLAEGRDRAQACLVGSVKSNIGHLEGASGIAGLIKTALALHHGQVPPTLHCDPPNPRIAFDELRLRAADRLRDWTLPPEDRFAGVSAFGFGGTNVHVVLQGVRSAHEQREAEDGAWILPLSAPTAAALRTAAADALDFVQRRWQGTVADAVYTHAVRREHHRHRAAIVGCSLADLTEGLERLVAKARSPWLVSSDRPAGVPGPIAFVFTGHGSQWLAMGRELMHHEPVFRSALEEFDALATPHTGWSVCAELAKPEESCRFDGMHVEHGQVGGVALQWALVRLMASWGITPDHVVGHSVGEIAAALTAGRVDLKEATRIVATRSRLIREAAEEAVGYGAMAMVEAPHSAIQNALAAAGGAVSVAATNSSTSTVITGEHSALALVRRMLEADGVFVHPIDAPGPGHSPYVDGIRAGLEAALRDQSVAAGTIPMTSTVLGADLGDVPCDAQYWGRNLREPVAFLQAVESLLQRGVRTFVEVGPHPMLTPAIKRTLADAGQEGLVLPTLSRSKPERRTLLKTVARLYVEGHRVEWRRMYPAARQALPLQRLSWSGVRCWMDRAGRNGRALRVPAREDVSEHALLGSPLSVAALGDGRSWQTTLDAQRFPYLRDHVVQGAVLVPTTFWLALAMAGAAEVFGRGPQRLWDVTLERGLFLSPDDGYALQTFVKPAEDGARFEIFAAPVGSGGATRWIRHASGWIAPLGKAALPPPSIAIDESGDRLSSREHYRRLADWGVEYGPWFRGLSDLVAGNGRASGHVRAPQHAAVYHFGLHPAFVDACLQVAAAAIPERFVAETAQRGLYLPVAIDSVVVLAEPTADVTSHAAIQTRADQGAGYAADVDVRTDAGQPLLSVRGFRIKRVEHADAGQRDDSVLHSVEWRLLDDGEPAADPHRWLIVADQRGVAECVARNIRDAGEVCSVVASSSGPVLAEALAQSRPDRVVDLSALPAPDGASSPAEETSLAVFTRLAEATRDALPNAPPGQTWWLVTQGAQRVHDGESPNPGQAMVWGFGRCLSFEQPQRWGGLVDLDPAAPPDVAASCLCAALRRPMEEQIALRGDERFAPRLVRWNARSSARSPRIRPDVAYLITGGLGGIGAKLGEWLVERGARHLVLTGRSALPPREEWNDIVDPGQRARIAAIERLEAMGARVLVATADAADLGAMRRLLAGQRIVFPPVRGVFHLAGVIEPRLLSQLDRHAIEQAFNSKALGASNLDRLFDSQNLDWFVCFSSAAGIWGSTGLAHYAAANHFVDALMAARRARGLPGQSIAWGRWADVGAAADAAIASTASAMGLYGLDPALAFDAMVAVAREGSATEVVAKVDWVEFRSLYEHQAPRRRLLVEIALEQASALEVELRSLAGDLAGLPRERALELLVEVIRDEISVALGQAKQEIGPDVQLDGLGLDSLMALDIKNRMERRLATRVPVVALLTSPTPRQLADTLLAHLRSEKPQGVDLASRATLPREIRVEAVTRSVCSPARNILLTGATGFLGAFLFGELLRTTDARIHCLVRASSESHGRERIAKVLAFHRIDVGGAEVWNRVAVVPGDLELPGLGVAHRVRDELESSIDLILHSAAWLNPVYDYTDLEATNVHGTRELLRLACAQAIPFHFISSLAIFPWDQTADGARYDEVPAGPASGLPCGYCESKWVAEQIVTQAADRGLDVTVYRPGLITASSVTGVGNDEDLFARFVAGCIELGVLPNLRGAVDMTPVDYASRAISHIALSPKRSHRFYHVTNPCWMPWDELASAIQQAGYPLQRMSYEAWVKSLERAPAHNVLQYILPLLSVPERAVSGLRTFATQHTEEALRDADIRCPKADAELFSKYLAHYAAQGLVSHPANRAQPKPESPWRSAPATPDEVGG